MKTFGFAFLCVFAFSGAALAQHNHSHGEQPVASQTDTSRQADVAARGVTVMPFDLDRSTHIFDRTVTGGTQTVVSKDRAPDQVALIREHLEQEAAAFAQGDYGSPAAIHGTEMPGLDVLSGAGDGVKVAYEPLPDGARILFSSSDPVLVQAIHSWFIAQVSDHGAHAAHGSSH